MTRAENDDWPIGQIVIVPHAWRGDGLWREIQVDTQQRIGSTLRERIGSTLREMYAELLQQPLSPGLIKLTREIELRSETGQHDN